MSLVTLDEAKAYLRIEHEEEDDLLNSLIVSAEEWSKGFCNRELSNESDKTAVKSLVAHWYENRGAVSTGNTIPREIPFGVKSILSMQRKFPI